MREEYLEAFRIAMGARDKQWVAGLEGLLNGGITTLEKALEVIKAEKPCHFPTPLPGETFPWRER
jgi:hypothetical protein